MREYRIKNRDKINKTTRTYRKNQYKIDTDYKIRQNLKSRIWASLNGIEKSQKTIELLGCSIRLVYLKNSAFIILTCNHYGVPKISEKVTNMTNKPSYKPGYKSTEFWTVLASFIFSGLFLTGVISEKDQTDELTNIATHGIESCILIGGQLFILYRYIAGRNQVKKIAAAHESTEQTNARSTRKPSKPRKTSKSTKPRTTKTRKSKTSENNQD